MMLRGRVKRWDTRWHAGAAERGMRALHEAGVTERQMSCLFRDCDLPAASRAALFDECVRTLARLFPSSKAVAYDAEGRSCGVPVAAFDPWFVHPSVSWAHPQNVLMLSAGEFRAMPASPHDDRTLERVTLLAKRVTTYIDPAPGWEQAACATAVLCTLGEVVTPGCRAPRNGEASPPPPSPRRRTPSPGTPEGQPRAPA